MSGDLERAVAEEMQRLKSVDSTLDLLQKSGKKELQQYLSSSKNSHPEKEKERGNLENLSEIKLNLFPQFQKLPSQSLLPLQKQHRKAKPSRQQQLHQQVMAEHLRKQALLAAKQQKQAENHKLSYQMQLLCKLRCLHRRLKRHGLP